MEKNELELQKLKLDLEKAELEKRKLERDLDTNKPFRERDRFWAETFRLIAITLITAVTSAVVARQTEGRKADYQIQLEEFKVFLKLKEEFGKPANNLDDKKRIFCVIKEEFSQMDRPSVQNFITRIKIPCSDSTIHQKEQEISTQFAKAEKNAPEPVVKALNATEKKISAVTQRIDNASAAERTDLEKEKGLLIQRLDSLLKVDPAVLALSKSSEDVESLYTAQTESINREIRTSAEYSSAAGYPRTTWFKEGYSLPFDDMKIILEDINEDRSLTVSVCNSTDGAPCSAGNLLKSHVKLTSETPLEIQRDEATYFVRLDRIGRAGKNPFSKAAYVTFEKVNK
jgi:hypothetical protein